MIMIASTKIYNIIALTFLFSFHHSDTYWRIGVKDIKKYWQQELFALP